MAHWITKHGDNLKEELENAVSNTEWTLTVSNNDGGPIELTHEDGSEISLVQSQNTQTFAVEYVPGDDATAGVNLNKRTYHHQSFGWNEPENAVEWAANIIKQHEKKN